MNPINNRARGKSAERRIAALMNGRRVGILGKEDVETDKFSIEVKSRKKFVASGWMDQAVKCCRDGNTCRRYRESP